MKISVCAGTVKTLDFCCSNMAYKVVEGQWKVDPAGEFISVDDRSAFRVKLGYCPYCGDRIIKENV